MSPAVVNIRSFRSGKEGEGRDAGKLMPVGIGSGVVIDKDRGLIVTNQHVVKDGEQFIVRPGHGGEWPAQLVGADPNTDLAVLQIKAPVMVQAEWGDPDTLAVGDWVLAIGSPFMLDQSVAAGIISATGRNNLGVVAEGGYEDFLQTDAAVNPGNSGGPLVDLRGNVVGINTAVSMEGDASGGKMPGIGLAISASLAKRITDQIIKDGHVTRGYIGVRLATLRPAQARAMGIPEGRGALIDDVEPGGPADRAGLRRGDVIVAIDDKPVADFSALRTTTSGLGIGKEVALNYYRQGRAAAARVTIGPLPVLRTLGLGVHDQKMEDGQTRLVIDSIQGGSPAFRERLGLGWIVLSVNDRPVSTKAEADAAAEGLDPGAGIPVKVLRPDGRAATYIVGGSGRRP